MDSLGPAQGSVSTELSKPGCVREPDNRAGHTCPISALRCPAHIVFGVGGVSALGCSSLASAMSRTWQSLAGKPQPTVPIAEVIGERVAVNGQHPGQHLLGLGTVSDPSGCGQLHHFQIGGCLSTRWGGFLKPHCPLCPKRGRPASGSHTGPGHPIVCCCPLLRPPACLSFFSPQPHSCQTGSVKGAEPACPVKGPVPAYPRTFGQTRVGKKAGEMAQQ